MTPTGDFTRSKSGGVFKVKGPSGSVNYPPTTIRDLQLFQDTSDAFYTSFTFPGADLNSGTINSYIIFYAENRSSVDDLTAASNVSVVTEEMLICENCNLDPLPASTKTMLRLNSSYFTPETDYYFRILAIDQPGDNAKTSSSNVVLFAPIPAPMVAEEVTNS